MIFYKSHKNYKNGKSRWIPCKVKYFPEDHKTMIFDNHAMCLENLPNIYIPPTNRGIVKKFNFKLMYVNELLNYIKEKPSELLNIPTTEFIKKITPDGYDSYCDKRDLTKEQTIKNIVYEIAVFVADNSKNPRNFQMKDISEPEVIRYLLPYISLYFNKFEWEFPRWGTFIC